MIKTNLWHIQIFSENYLKYHVTSNKHFIKAADTSSRLSFSSQLRKTLTLRIFSSSGHNPYRLQEFSDRPKNHTWIPRPPVSLTSFICAVSLNIINVSEGEFWSCWLNIMLAWISRRSYHGIFFKQKRFISWRLKLVYISILNSNDIIF